MIFELGLVFLDFRKEGREMVRDMIGMEGGAVGVEVDGAVLDGPAAAGVEGSVGAVSVDEPVAGG